ncbi:zinc-dependent alcohol dehydrogenase [Cohnella abietis]|uniref:Alcohol dehydrogenase n=1 Tax=Cohnella abietis TaxID=2507935 RepID=A0A3T1DBJ1_9BACL|nr:alcohol dehydrogenase catalytic domain-containing protein [Cohnella abietis]BBI35467.1 alcohol dehydrogenase [Cohnella abietis]
MSLSMMQALVYEGPKQLNLRNIAVPTPRKNEVLVQVERVGICGSELSGYLGESSIRTAPLVMGHEFSGRIVSVGEEVKGFSIGDRVAPNPLISCRSCRYCLSGYAQLCPDRLLLGAHIAGAFAEYVAVPESNLYILEDKVSYEEGAIAEPLACGVHACRQLKLQPTDRLLICGGGPIGLLAYLAAKQFGVDQVVIYDLNESRLAIARELGAIAVRTNEELINLMPVGGFDASIDAVGVQATRSLCVKNTRVGGKVSFIGLHEAESLLPINEIVRNEIQLIGTFAYTPLDFETALRWITEGKIAISSWTETASLSEGKACFDKLLSNSGGGVLKFMLSMGHKED